MIYVTCGAPVRRKKPLLHRMFRPAPPARVEPGFAKRKESQRIFSARTSIYVSLQGFNKKETDLF
jgi:hypothetical protein